MCQNERYLEIDVCNTTEAIAVLLELRRKHFFSFRGQRDHTWPLGPHDFPDIWESKVHSIGELTEKNAEKKNREDQTLASFNDRDKKIYWKSKSIRRYINERLLQYIRHTQLIDERATRFDERDWWYNLIIAHHNGLKTLLLDWTSNPLVALYFAVENIISKEMKDKFGAVFALKVRDTPINEERWFDFDELVNRFPCGEFCPKWIMINPPFNSDRIIRQSGKFTYHPSIIDRDLLENHPNNKFGIGEALVKIIIRDKDYNPADLVRKELGIMNIHHGSLFPDQDGIASYINSEWDYIANRELIKGPVCPYPSSINGELLNKVRYFIDSID